MPSKDTDYAISKPLYRGNQNKYLEKTERVKILISRIPKGSGNTVEDLQEMNDIYSAVYSPLSLSILRSFTLIPTMNIWTNIKTPYISPLNMVESS